ncbi:MAG: hypothetical protein C5B47_06060 [Verrucomicrobia bacterium]|nr:MAG: hypothetical protein C5B47_06060 [Verrucomicrobiota bacterium]
MEDKTGQGGGDLSRRVAQGYTSLLRVLAAKAFDPFFPKPPLPPGFPFRTEFSGRNFTIEIPSHMDVY